MRAVSEDREVDCLSLIVLGIRHYFFRRFPGGISYPRMICQEYVGCILERSEVWQRLHLRAI